MRFHADGPNIPTELIQAQASGDVVFFCGAGVSMPAGLPSFYSLTNKILKGLGVPNTATAYKLFKRAEAEQDPDLSWPLDQIVGLLQRDYGQIRVEAEVAKHLRPKARANLDCHRTILRLSKDADARPRLITTNFDQFFEKANGTSLKCFVPPVLPDLDMGHPFDGLVYLHGRLDKRLVSAKLAQGLVLGAADFGRAYLSDGWATQFLNQILMRHVVVLLGYSADDPPVRYLLEGLRSNGSENRQKVYAFVQSAAGSTEQRWLDRGVEIIPYAKSDIAHSSLWNSLAAWADRADDPDRWAAEIIAKAAAGPTALSPHERGQVAQFVSTRDGGKAFADASSPPPADWLCVFDASVRYAKPATGWPAEGIFDPLANFGLDDDPPRTEEQPNPQRTWGIDFLSPNNFDERGEDFRRLVSTYPAQSFPLPPRMADLARWIGRVADHPTTVWWAARHFGLHSYLVDGISARLRDTTQPMLPVMRKAWALLIEALSDVPEQHQRNWFALSAAIKRDGWTGPNLREFENVTKPRLVARAPSMSAPRPPKAPVAELQLRNIVDFDVNFPSLSNLTPLFSAENIASIVVALRRNLEIATGLNRDLAPLFHRLPTLIPPETPGDRHIDDESAYFLAFSRLISRLREADIQSAKAEIEAWPRSHEPPYYFSKLRIWLLMYPDMASSSEVARALLQLPSSVFWHHYLSRELLWTLRGRWAEFNEQEKAALEQRLVAGPDRMQNEEEDSFEQRKSSDAASKLGWLKTNGCAFSPRTLAALVTLRVADPYWSERADLNADDSLEPIGGWVKTDTDTSILSTVSVSRIVETVESIDRRPAGLLVEKNPFLGLVQENPVRAIAALVSELKQHRYPVRYWQTLLTQWPKTLGIRAIRYVLCRVTTLPSNVIAELRYELCHWFDDHASTIWSADGKGFLKAWDHLFGALAGSEEATASSMGEVTVGGVPQRLSRRTFGHAINAPIGMLTRALNASLAEQTAAGSGVPGPIRSRFQRCLTAAGEGGDHAVSMLLFQLRWYFFLDPEWSKLHLVPLLELQHPSADPAWEAFLQSGNMPSPELFLLIKRSFFSALEQSSNFAWEERATRRFGQYIVVGLAASWEGTRYFTSVEARSALQSTDDEARLGALDQVAFMLKNGSTWSKLGERFFREVWPFEQRFQTSATTRALADIAAAADDEFPKVIERVADFLRPSTNVDTFIYRWKRGDKEDRPSIAQAFPAATIRALGKLVEDNPRTAPYDLEAILRETAQIEPALKATADWKRLEALVKRQ